MIKKRLIENFLKLNGIPLDAEDQIIRSALVEARWHEEDVEVALLVLKGNRQNDTVEVTAARQLFHSDARVAPETLSSLLGVTVNIDSNQLYAVYRDDEKYDPVLHPALTTLFLIAGAFVIGLAMMYAMRIGPFHQPVEHFVF
ncbi:hypothetical protein KTR10_02475 [Candidatus Kaiserbacteria bacterium]|nr:hypothetical protein [Candidatus Kaiserbacteria bacterium]